MDEIFYRNFIEISNYDKNFSYEDVCIYSNITIRRNLVQYKFVDSLNDEERENVSKEIKEALFLFDKNIYFIDTMSFSEEQYLLAYIYSLLPKKIEEPFYIGVQKNKNVFFHINNQDHLRFFIKERGLSFHSIFFNISEIECKLSQNLDFAFDKKIGYVAPQLLKSGIAMDFSVVMHLPAISMIEGKLDYLKKDMEEKGFLLTELPQHFFSEVSRLYILKNQIFFNISEEEMLFRMYNIVKEIIDIEYENRNFLWKKAKNSMEDKIYRAYGLLKYAKKMSYVEFLDNWTFLRMGIGMGIIKNNRISKIDRYLFNLTDAYLNLFYANNRKDIDEIRMSLIDLDR